MADTTPNGPPPIPERELPPPIPNTTRWLPKGALTDKVRRRIYVAVGALLAILILFSGIGSNPPPPNAKPVVTKEVDNVNPARINAIGATLKDQADKLQAALEKAKQDAAQDSSEAGRLAALQAEQAKLLAGRPRPRANGGVVRHSVPASSIVEDLRPKRNTSEGYPVQQAAYAQPINYVEPSQAAAEANRQMEASLHTQHALRTPQPGDGVSPADNKPVDALRFDPALPTYILPEGTVIEMVLTNKLEGSNGGPVDCMISTPVYAPGTHRLLLPEGVRVMGDTTQVNTFGQQRLAVRFHRILVQNGTVVYSIPLDKEIPGLDQQGATALPGKVNAHILSAFGTALALGAVAGLVEVGNTTTGFGFDPAVEFRVGVTQSLGQSAMQILNKFTNRLPTIVIPPGTRVKMILIGDVKMPGFPGVPTP